MRPRLVAALAAGLLLALAWHGRAQEDEARALLERGIRALGGEERLLKYQAGRIKTKGRLEIMGGLDTTQDTVYQLPNKFRQVMELDINNQKITIVTAFDGKKGAIEVNGMKLPSDEKIMQALKEGAYQAQIGRLVPLRQKEFELSGLGEVQVNGKPALGMRVVKKGQPDVNFYFDKQTNLLVKSEIRTHDFMSGQEVTEERIITEYQTVDGMPVAKKVEIVRDGKRFMDAEVLDAKFYEKLDDADFAVP